MTRFVSNNDLWLEIQQRVGKGKRVRAAIAYFGKSGASLLPLKKGDSLVVDMSIKAVSQGVTNPRAVQALMNRGVKIFSRGSLHAKFLIVDNTLIASSANASSNSKQVLDEAGIITKDAAAVRRATGFFDKLCTEPVGEEYLKQCISAYRPPIFKPAIESHAPRSKVSRRVVEAKLWFVGGLETLNLTENARKSIHKIERRHEKRLKRSGTTEVTWIRYGREPKFLRQIRVGNWIVECTKDGRARYIDSPKQMLGFDNWVSYRNKRYTLVMLEMAKNGESMPLTQFRKLIASVQPELNRPNPRTRAIENNDRADSILRLWTAAGKIAKARRSSP